MRLFRGECTDTLRRRITELETECKKLTLDIKLKEDQIRELELKVQVKKIWIFIPLLLKEESLVEVNHVYSMCWPNFSIFRVCQELHKYKENEKDTEVLMSALSAMQDKTQHLENSLSAETRIKLDLFSALGDAKRQLEIAQGRLISSAQRCPGRCLSISLGWV